MAKVLQSPFHLIEADKLSEEELTSHAFAGTMAFILRNQFRKHLTQELHKIMASFNQLEACDHTRYLLELIQYILNIDEEHSNVEELIGIMQNNLSPNIKGEIMSLAEKLIEQGVQKGLREGELKGKLEGKLEGIREGEQKKEVEIAVRMLAEGSDPVFIEKVTGLSLKQIKTLKPN